MKKKVIIPIIAGLVLIVGIIGYLVWNNRTVSVITLDINPSIKINLNKKDEVKKIIAVNKDAKKIVKSIKLDNNKSLDYVIDRIADEVEGNGFLTESNLVDIVLYTDGKVTTDKVNGLLHKSFSEDGIAADVIVIKKITKEDIKLAKKYNINPAKASYINSAIKDKTYIDAENLANRAITEIRNTKDNGYYCDEGYTLDGSRCLKEKKRVKASTGDICPQDYYEYNGKCYEMNEGTITDNLKCNDPSATLQGKMCVSKQIYDARPNCDDYDGGLDKCVKKTYVGEAFEYCRLTPGEDLLYNHRCLARKPTINGGCLGSDVVIDGWCYDTSANSGYEADWVCKTGDNPVFAEEDHKCYERTYYDVPSYYCEGEGKVEGKKCVVIHKEGAFNERICPSGFTRVDMDVCINLNNSVAKEKGFVCDSPDSRVVDNICIIYEAKDAKQG